MQAVAATVDDIDTIGRLAREIWLEHYPAVIGMEQTEYMLERMYHPQALTEQMGKGHEFFLWRHEGRNIGFAAIDTTPSSPGFLAKFYLDSSFRGKGVAQRFLAFLEDRFREAGKEAVRLTVNRQNIGAINFYFKSGFKIIRCEDFDIGNGYFMNDFVMEKRLAQ